MSDRREFCKLTLTAFAAVGIVPITVLVPETMHVDSYLTHISLAFIEDVKSEQFIASAVFPVLSKSDWQYEYFHTGIWGAL